ncbi:MAG: T9SS type A sorting domain-containing protein [Bacteroidetes bacterium]|nr:T9SS type A sorting domain-containing protein [Bacteroidota bacterium]
MNLSNCRLNNLVINLKYAILTVLLSLCCNLFTIGQIAVTTNSSSGLAASYSNLAAAITALNAATITAPVIINCAPGSTETFTLTSGIITATGSSVNTITIKKNGIGANPLITAGVGNSATDAIIKIAGGNYITIDGIDVKERASNSTPTTQMEYGYYISNASAINGAQHDSIKNCKITLNRSNTSSIAFYQNVATTPSSIDGANSYNTFQFITIENSYQGIIINGNASFPDINIEVSNCIIGASTPNYDIGNGSNTALSGIQLINSSNIKINNNEVRNLLTNNIAAVNLYGIYIQSLQGLLNKVYNNFVHDLTTTNTSSTARIYAIRIDINTGQICNVFNNTICKLMHGINSYSSNQPFIQGLTAGLVGYGSVNFYFNSVRIEEDQYPTSTCLYLGGNSSTPPMYNIQNNIFANYSTIGSGTSKRYCIYFNSSAVNLNSINYNNYYILSGTNNFIGYLYADQSNLISWRYVTLQDANSINTNPNFTSTSDLTPTAGNFIPGTAISNVKNDINSLSRNDPPAMGAYEGSIAGRWLGTTSTDWDVATNWDGNNVPTAASNVYIGATPLNQPLITNSAATPSVCNNLTIYPEAVLTVNAGKALTVNGTINNMADTTGFVLKSDASATASLIQNTANVGATLERFIPNDNSWHFLSSPVDNQNIKPEFAPITADNTFDFFKWDETNLIDPGYPWLNIRNGAGNYMSGFDNFENGRGYLVAYSNAYGSSTHNFSGHLNTGNITIPITNGGNNYNLIGNPYPSAIDWDNTALVVETNYTLGSTPAYWIWNETVGNYATYNSLSGGVNNASHIIAPHQGFFVQAVNPGSILLSNAVRLHPGSQNFLKSTANNLLRLKLSSTANNYSDEIIVNFNSNALPDAGVAKWFSLLADAPSLYTVKNSKNFSINTLPALSNTLIVPLSFKAGINGSYSIKASELSSFTTNTYIYLKDLKANLIQELYQNDTYSFSGLTGDAAERFQLIFSISPLIINNETINNCNIYVYDNILYLNTNENIKQITVYNMLGQLIKTIYNPGKLTSFRLNALPPDYYIVKLLTAENLHTAKVLVK